MGLSLGDIEFSAFEVPSAIAFGGAQSLAVYRLPGGARVVDTLGPNDSEIAWRGVFSGPNSSSRARSLNELRVSGTPIPLTWDEFSFTVIIASLDMEFCNSWWIPYQISCVIVEDPIVQLQPTVGTIIDLVLSDLASAAQFEDVSTAIGAVTEAGNALVGSPLFASAMLSLVSAQAQNSASIVSSELALGSGDLEGVVVASASLASATAARGYVGRALKNYSQSY